VCILISIEPELDDIKIYLIGFIARVSSHFNLEFLTKSNALNIVHAVNRVEYRTICYASLFMN